MRKWQSRQSCKIRLSTRLQVTYTVYIIFIYVFYYSCSTQHLIISSMDDKYIYIVSPTFTVQNWFRTNESNSGPNYEFWLHDLTMYFAKNWFGKGSVPMHLTLFQKCGNGRSPVMHKYQARYSMAGNRHYLINSSLGDRQINNRQGDWHNTPRMTLYASSLN